MGVHSAKKAIISMEVSPNNSIPIGEVRSYSIETALGTIDVSVMSSQWKKYLVGQAGWTASLEMFYDPSDEAQEELVNRTIAGDPVQLTILPLGADEVYILDLGTNSDGTFKLNNGGDIETDDLAWDSTAGDIQAALRDAYELTGIFVTGADGDFTITFPSGFTAELDIDSSLTGGTGETVDLEPIPAEMTGTGSVTTWSNAGATEDAVGLSVSIQGNGELVIING